MRGCSLLDKIFAIYLYITLHKLIGQKCLTIKGAEDFGIKTILVWFNCLSINPPKKKLLTEATTSTLIIFQ